jgi:hypothetical protein
MANDKWLKFFRIFWIETDSSGLKLLILSRIYRIECDTLSIVIITYN